MRRVLVILMLGAMLGACGSEEESAPDLAALPTRTPVPPTEIVESGPAQANVEIVSLRDEIDAFLTEAETTSPLDRPVLFNDVIVNPNRACLTGSMFPGIEPLELLDFNLVSLDLTLWREPAANFPEADLIEMATQTLNRATELMPPDGVFRLCLVPIPYFGPPDVVPPNFGVETMVVGANTLLVLCAAGPACLTRVQEEVAYGYGYAYQLEQTGLTATETPVLTFAIYAGRATDFARQLFPNAPYAWDNALTAAQEASTWEVMQEYMPVTYLDYPLGRNVDKVLYGGGPTTADRYPAWGGVYIGTRIVEAYRARHPDVSVVELAALDPETLLAESGYSPE